MGRVRFFCDTGIHETRFCIAKMGFVETAEKGTFSDREVGSEQKTSGNRISGRSFAKRTVPLTKSHADTPVWVVSVFFGCDTGIHEARFCESKNVVRRSSRKGASAFADCGVGSTRNFSQNARSVQKMRERTVPRMISHTDTPVWVVSVFFWL